MLWTQLPSGNFYQGDLLNDKMDGRGIILYPGNNQVVLRYFKNGRNADGPFTLFDSDGSVKEGEWKNNLRTGETTVITADFRVKTEIVNPRVPTKKKEISQIYRPEKKRKNDEYLKMLETSFKGTLFN